MVRNLKRITNRKGGWERGGERMIKSNIKRKK
jgi:hypothetical protein